jgi:23S rRNA pseudouridine1911/1915/1917 synthase
MSSRSLHTDSATGHEPAERRNRGIRLRPGAPRALPARGQIVAPVGCTLASALRATLPGRSWSDLRHLCASGKIYVNGERELNAARRLAGGETVAWNLAAPDPRRTASPPGFRIVYEDGHLIVIEKPEGISSVPYERKERGTALDLIREAWRHQGKRAAQNPLYTVHRIDKDTSGLLCFAKTRLAERGLHRVFQQHQAEREYIAVAHGLVRPVRIESSLVADRGDGLRGSTRRPRQGQRAVTHVEVIETLPTATMCRVRLETGRTHQIRIHLAEQQHPLVGETVYVRDYTRIGRTLLPSNRLLLHAAMLGFAHPVSGERLHWTSALPSSFEAELQRLRG